MYYKYCITASEILRYLLQYNKFDLLSEFYQKYLLDISPGCKTQKYDAISFEGFYINENIMGLINTLHKRLYRLCRNKTNPIKSMNNYFSHEMITINNKLTNGHSIFDIPHDRGNETRSQTYFVRDFLRTQQHIHNNQRYDFFQPHRQSSSSNGSKEHIILENMFADLETYESVSWYGKTLQDWFEKSYDFNKVYADQPPIETFMAAYFGKDTNNKDIIDNFYLFYVVSNDDKSKCSNQIKLISDSEIFIRTIREYIPGKC
jgi:hypothetical protein